MTKLVAYGENGRRVGESHHHATIPETTVTQIRDLHEEHGWGYRRIAKHLALAWYTVAKIAKYQRRASFPTRWERVPEAQDGPTA